jgi:hypothetical protein
MAGDLALGLASGQLAAIGSLSATLEQLGIEYWLFGGWAVDFCVGRMTRYTLDGVLVEFTLVVSDESGAAILPLPEGPFVWSSEPFAGERRELAGVGSTTIPLSLLKVGKSTARDDPTDAVKDRADFGALSELAH